MIIAAIPVVPVSKLSVAEEALSKVGFKLAWSHNPGKDLMYGEFQHPDGAALHASESRGDGTGPIVVYFQVNNIDNLAAQVGVTAEDQPWHMREFWLRDCDGNAYRFGQPIDE